MDLNKSTAMDRSSEGWTEEKHASFLNKMEESFVRKTFGFDAKWMRAPLRLDRFVPDSATESNRSVMDVAAADRGFQHFAGKSLNKITKKRSILHKDSSEDQVVPQFGRPKGDDDNAHRNKKGCNQLSRWL